MEQLVGHLLQCERSKLSELAEAGDPGDPCEHVLAIPGAVAGHHVRRGQQDVLLQGDRLHRVLDPGPEAVRYRSPDVEVDFALTEVQPRLGETDRNVRAQRGSRAVR